MTAPAKVEHAGALATFRDAPVAVRFLLLGVFLNQFGAFLQAFLVLYLLHRGFSAGQAGFALGAYGVGAVLGVLGGGGLTDRLGPRLTIIGSMLSAAAFTLAVSFLGSYPAIVVVVLLAGAVTQGYRPAAAAMLTGMTPPARQVMIMAMNRLALNLGTMVGPLVAVALITVSWNLIFYLDAATSLAYVAIAVFLLPQQPATQPAGQPLGSAAAGAPTCGYRVMLADRRYVAFLVSMLTNALIHIQLVAVLPLTLQAEGYSRVVYGSVFAVGAGIVVSCELLVTRRTQQWPAHRAVTLGFLLLGAGLLGYGLPGGIPVIVAATIVNELGQISGGPTVFAWPAKVAPAGMAGRYLGSALAMFGLGQALGPILGVLIFEHIGRNFWWLCGAVGVLSAVIARYAMRQPPLGAVPTATLDDEPAALAPATGEPIHAPTGGRTT